MKKLSLLMAACIAVLAVSCSPEPTNAKASLSVAPTTLEFEASGNASKTVTVTAENVKWQITMSAESKAWITATKTDDKTVTVTVSDNETTAPRNGSVVIEPIDNDNVEAKRVTVTQKGDSSTGEYTLTVEPASMTFVGEGAEPQEATVTVSNEKLKWTVAPEDAIKDWVTVSAEGDKITVSVSDNPDTAERVGNIVITPGVESVRPKAIRVTQEGKILPPSLEVNKNELTFKFKPGFGETVVVTAVNVKWDAKVSDTPDEVGGNVPWINKPQLFTENGNSYFTVSVKENTTLEERTGYIIVTSDVPEVPNVTVTVKQDAGKKFISTLTGDREITDLQANVNNYVFFSPNQVWLDRPVAFWDMDIWASTVVQRHESSGYDNYSGQGTRLHLELMPDRIVYNYDEEFELPEGDYMVQTVERDQDGKEIFVPFTVKAGSYTEGDMRVVPGSWYLHVSGGEEENVYDATAPLVGGKVNVSRNGEDYVLTFDLLDDAGNKITGSCVSKLDNMRINFFEEKEPDPNDPNNPQEPENPDEPGNPDDPTPFRR